MNGWVETMDGAAMSSYDMIWYPCAELCCYAGAMAWKLPLSLRCALEEDPSTAPSRPHRRFLMLAICFSDGEAPV